MVGRTMFGIAIIMIFSANSGIGELISAQLIPNESCTRMRCVDQNLPHQRSAGIFADYLATNASICPNRDQTILASRGNVGATSRL